MNDCETMRVSAADMLQRLGFQSGFADSALLVRLGYVYCNGEWEKKHSNLTAAAPDLYAALERLVEDEPTRSEFQSAPKGDRQYAESQAAYAAARAALAKAMGEER